MVKTSASPRSSSVLNLAARVAQLRLDAEADLLGFYAQACLATDLDRREPQCAGDGLGAAGE